MKWNFLYQITDASRLGGYRPQIPVLSVLCPQLNLLNPPTEKKNPGYATANHHCVPPGLTFKNSNFITQNITIVFCVFFRTNSDYHVLSYTVSTDSFLGGLAKLRKATINFVMSLSVRPAHMEYFVSNWKDFHEIWYLSILRKKIPSRKFEFKLKSHNNNRYCTWRPIHMYDNSAPSSHIEKCFRQQL